MGSQSPSQWRKTMRQADQWLLAQLARLRPYLLHRLTLLALITALLLTTCSPKRTPWEQLQADGVLRLITYNSATTYYLGPEGETGFEYDLAKRFAEYLGVRLEVITADNPQDLIQRLLSNQAHIAAGLTITESRKQQLDFGPALHSITQQLVYRAGQPKPKSLQAAIQRSKGRLLEVSPGSSHAEKLEGIENGNPALHWVENPYANSEELLYRVAEGEIDYTIAHSHLIKLSARYYPQIRVALDTDEAQQLAWALSPQDADKLLPLTKNFVKKIKKNGELERIIHRYFSETDNLGYVGAVKFAEHVGTRLPLYEEAFKTEAEKHQLDWRLLAAVGYQESHWKRHARSPTGVRGLMMLTKATAKQMGIKDREDPFQSIIGGARYLREQIDRQPPEITDPDRTWMGLATYNIGHGHMIDARELTRQLGGNPYHWIDVRRHLPLLMQARWHRRTKYGYARGREAMRYVANIRSYYDILRWMTTTEEMPTPEGLDPEVIKRPDAPTRALDIDSPIL